MFGQYQNSFASASKWLFLGFACIIVMALLLGMNVKDATWFNPEIAKAEAKSIEIEAAHQEATYKLQEQLAQAQTEAEIQSVQRQQKLLDAQYEHDIQALSQDLAHRETRFKTWMTVLTIVGGALSVAIIVCTVLWVGSKALVFVRTSTPHSQPSASTTNPPINNVQPLPAREPYDPWQSQRYRRAKIKEARYRERASRKAELGQDQNKMPLAG
jgi:hypothetical protein